MLRRLTLSIILSLTFLAGARAGTPEGDRTRADIQAALGFVPGFLAAIPDHALPGVWGEFTSLQMSTTTKLSLRTKELIGLAVASQIPCRYCIYAHTEFGTLAGATKAEIGEAVALAAQARHWSTFLNGLQPDEQVFRAWVDATIAHLKAPPTAAKATRPPADPGKAAPAEAQAVFGSAPEHLARFPAASVAAAWRGLRDVELAQTAVSGKEKALISLAVAAQIPSRYCVIADTAFARLAGATDEEIREAIAMSSLVRLMSTYLNGLQIDEAGFRADVDRVVRDARKAAAKAARPN